MISTFVIMLGLIAVLFVPSANKHQLVKTRNCWCKLCVSKPEETEETEKLVNFKIRIQTPEYTATDDLLSKAFNFFIVVLNGCTAAYHLLPDCHGGDALCPGSSKLS